MFKKPNTKSVTNAALTGGALVVGAKVGDGISAVMPESTNGYKRWILGIGGVVAAACINPSTTAAQGAQNALLGLGAKQLYDELSDTLAEAIPVKVAADATVALSVTDKFVNAIVGHLGAPAASIESAWEGDNSDMWARPLEIQNDFQDVLFVGV